MTLAERGLSTAKVSLRALFEGKFAPSENHASLEDYASWICHGGWPALLNSSEERAQETVEEYLDLLFSISMRKMGRNPILSRRIAVSLARNLGTSATLGTLCKDAAAGDTAPSEETLSGYLTDFRLNFFLDELPGWDAPVKSRSRVRTKPKRYLDDPSMATTLLSVDRMRLLEDGQLFGTLFESLCFHDMAVYAGLLPQASANTLSYYADADGLEVDFVIELRDGRWCAIEAKLGESKVEAAAKNLNRLKAKVLANQAARNREPEFMAVLVANAPYARQRKEDGIYVIPLSTLTA